MGAGPSASFLKCRKYARDWEPTARNWAQCELANSDLTRPAIKFVLPVRDPRASMGTIFINYRREDSISTAGRLHDRLSQNFGRKNIFMDVDHIPAGVDFVAHLNSQVAACNIFLVVIGPRWLEAKDENGARRLDNADDFVVIEIATALARNIRVIPILVDGARMPKAGELPSSLKALARRQAVEVRQLHFGRDADALVERVNEALGGGFDWQRPWRLKAALGAVAAALLLLAGIGLFSWSPWTETPQEASTGQENRTKIAAE